MPSPFPCRSARSLMLCAAAWLMLFHPLVLSQQPEPWEEAGPSGELARPGDTPAALDSSSSAAADTAAAPDKKESLRLLTLLQRGGPVMIPIYFTSILAVALAFERLLNLRTGKVIPAGLLEGLNQLSVTPSGFDPRRAYRLTQEYPSPAASVIRAMLLKVGRPLSEIETAVSEASQREGLRLYANVRWLHLIAAVAPLLGLFGTVWGMIRAFFDYSNLTAGQNKATFLAQGIYEALVTTLAGLAVAIPAAMLAYYFEGRVEAMMHRVEELLFNLMPQVERYEGRLRVSQQSLQSNAEPVKAAPATAATAAPPAPPATTNPSPATPGAASH